MPKFGITYKRPNAWSHRAKTDGSSDPLLKGPLLTPNNFGSRFARRLLLVTWITWCALSFVFFSAIQLARLSVFEEYLLEGLLSLLFDHIEIIQWLNLAAGIVVVLCTLTIVVSIILFKKRIVRARLQICPSCGYDLSNRVNEEPCPECGQKISRRELIRIWCKVLH